MIVIIETIRAVTITDEQIAMKNEDQLILTDNAIGTPALTETTPDPTPTPDPGKTSGIESTSSETAGHGEETVSFEKQLLADIEAATSGNSEGNFGYRRPCSNRLLVFLRNRRHGSNQLYQTEKTRNRKIKMNLENIKNPAVQKWLPGFLCCIRLFKHSGCMILYKFKKSLVNAQIIIQFRMEGHCQLIFVLYGNNMRIDNRKHVNGIING